MVAEAPPRPKLIWQQFLKEKFQFSVNFLLHIYKRIQSLSASDVPKKQLCDDEWPPIGLQGTGQPEAAHQCCEAKKKCRCEKTPSQ